MKKISFLLVFTLFIIACKPARFSDLSDGLYAEIETKRGTILLELYADSVPMTVANFVSLAEGTNTQVTDSLQGENYFDGLTFHRVVDNFVIQGGDPTATGRGTPGYTFSDEFPRDSTGNLLYQHDAAGILSMSNSGPNANGSQFFITHKPLPHLDGRHSVFGKTIVNSVELKNLKVTFKDSLKLLQAVDSVRMAVVNKIKQKDTILAVKIVRIGDKASDFDAAVVFEQELTKLAESKKDKQKREIEIEEARYSQYLTDKETFLAKMDFDKAEKTSSGLAVLKLKENKKGAEVVDHKPVKSHFTLYIADGTKIQSTEKSGQPFIFRLDDAQRPMITGFKEGVKQLREGEKARLFIPYYIGFGEAKYGPFPAKSDLIFEVEILKVGE